MDSKSLPLDRFKHTSPDHILGTFKSLESSIENVTSDDFTNKEAKEFVQQLNKRLKSLKKTVLELTEELRGKLD